MKRSQRYFLLASALVVISLLITACGGAVPTAAPAPTEAPAATEAPAPTEAPAATAAPAVTEAPKCPEPVDMSKMTAPASPKSITAAWSQEPDNVVEPFSNMAFALWMNQLTIIGLAKWDDKGNMIPDLAEEVPTVENGGVSADGLTITWHLKKCLYWSDGQPITSVDVKFTWQAIMDPGNAPVSRAGFDKIESIDTPDETTAVIKFKELFPPWYTLFSIWGFGGNPLMPEHILKGHTAIEKDPYIHQPNVGSGPFVITEWVAGDHMTLTANPNYYRGHAKLDQIQIKFVPDPETALAALQAGDVDVAPDFAESDIPTFAALEPAVHLRADPSGDFEHYFFNLGTVAGVDGKGKSDVDGFCPFKDVNVRKAIMLGIDRQTIVDLLLGGKTTVPASLWPNSSWYNTSLTPYPYDPEQAKKLLDDAGYKAAGAGTRTGKCDGKNVKLSFSFETTTKQLRKDIAVEVQKELKDIGIEFKPVHTPAGTFFGSYSEGANLATGKYDMAGYTTGFYPDPWNDNFLCQNVPNKDNPVGTNNYHLCDPVLEKMFVDANASADPAARKVVFDTIQKYMYDNALVVPMYARLNLTGYVDRFDPGPTAGLSGFMWDSASWDVK
ncbi:MAG: peptide ABC transporter substrate-binding protein [Chloroflexi bacterium]|nr:peptide ABC transporter substrate-binding protein [Chloroflexota bacterium]